MDRISIAKKIIFGVKNSLCGDTLPYPIGSAVISDMVAIEVKQNSRKEFIVIIYVPHDETFRTVRTAQTVGDLYAVVDNILDPIIVGSVLTEYIGVKTNQINQAALALVSMQTL